MSRIQEIIFTYDILHSIYKEKYNEVQGEFPSNPNLDVDYGSRLAMTFLNMKSVIANSAKPIKYIEAKV